MKTQQSGGISSGLEVLNVGQLDVEKLARLSDDDVVDIKIKKENVVVDPITITDEVHHKILFVMRRIPTTEWAGFLMEEDGVINDIHIPPQVGRSSTMDFEEGAENPDHKGFIHSHHTMGIRFSDVDDHGVNSNYDVSILVNWDSRPNTVNYIGSRRFDLGDNTMVRLQTDVEVEPVDLDFPELEEQLDENFEEGSTVTRYGGGYKRYDTYSGNQYSGRYKSFEKIKTRENGSFKFREPINSIYLPLFKLWIPDEKLEIAMEGGGKRVYGKNDSLRLAKATDEKLSFSSKKYDTSIVFDRNSKWLEKIHPKRDNKLFELSMRHNEFDMGTIFRKEKDGDVTIKDGEIVTCSVPFQKQRRPFFKW